MKIILFYLSLAILSLGISADPCICYVSLAGMNALWKKFGCDKKQAPTSTKGSAAWGPWATLKDMSAVYAYEQPLPDFKDANCNYLVHLYKFQAGQGVGTNWEGTKSSLWTGYFAPYYSGSGLQWNRYNLVTFWRKQDKIGDVNGKKTCKCFARATIDCKKDDVTSGCWWNS